MANLVELHPYVKLSGWDLPSGYVFVPSFLLPFSYLGVVKDSYRALVAHRLCLFVCAHLEVACKSSYTNSLLGCFLGVLDIPKNRYNIVELA